MSELTSNLQTLGPPIVDLTPLVLWSCLLGVLAKFSISNASFIEHSFYAIFGGFFAFLYVQNTAESTNQLLAAALGVASFFGAAYVRRDRFTRLSEVEASLLSVAAGTIVTFLIFSAYFQNPDIL